MAEKTVVNSHRRLGVLIIIEFSSIIICSYGFSHGEDFIDASESDVRFTYASVAYASVTYALQSDVCLSVTY